MNRTILHWSYLNFKKVPMDLYLYEDLEEIYLKENFITTIPKWLMNLTTLKFIHLAGNSLSELPEDLYLLENLEFLDVSNNVIKSLPRTIGYNAVLQRLNVSSNELTEIPAAIGNLKRLEQLNVSKNHLTSLPIELCECVRLKELSLCDNPGIWRIPERIANLPSLQSLSADRCSLIYLPVALSKFISQVRIFHNAAITHIPMIYEHFYASFYDSPQPAKPRIVDHPQFFFVLEKETFTKLLLPFGTRKIFAVPSKENLISLYDNCLHALNCLNRSTLINENMWLFQALPEKFMGDHLRIGPIARCTVKNCAKSLYTSYYFMVVKRRNSTSKQIFTCNFCSMFCANYWLQENSKKYYQVDWEICD